MRRESFITIPKFLPGLPLAENRDEGKLFKITEMPAAQAEFWAARALQAIARAGVDLPDYVRGAGMAGVAMVGLRGFGTLPVMDMKELMDEMFACVQICRTKDQNAASQLIDLDIEEVATRVYLRDKIFELHTGFSLAGESQTSDSSAATNKNSIQ